MIIYKNFFAKKKALYSIRTTIAIMKHIGDPKRKSDLFRVKDFFLFSCSFMGNKTRNKGVKGNGTMMEVKRLI